MKIAIIGAGKLGFKLAEALLGGDHAVTVIDVNDVALNKVISQMDVMTLHADGREIRVLESINISGYDYLIACTNSDEKNIVIASFAKKLGCNHVVARVREPEHMNQFDFIKETTGIDYIVNPDLSITHEIYKYLVEKYTLNNGIFSSGGASLIEFAAWKVPELVDLPVTQFKTVLPGMLAVALSRNGKVIVPHGDTVIQRNDYLYIIGEETPIEALSKKVHVQGKYTNLQKVMIIGGGKTGLYLAKKLSEFGISVKIIESNKERCYYLLTRLNDVMVLHGDGTDIAFLEEENLNEMDAFVTATGYDEENLLLALMAKQHGVEDVIAKVSRESYEGIIEGIGIDMALNPLDIEVSHLLRFMHGTKRFVSSQLIQGQAELIEIVADNHMVLMNKPLKELKLPEGILIAAIHSNDRVIIPDGNTVIKEGDRVIMLCHLSEIPELEKLFRTKKFSFFK
ncbi:MAG: Trk system potassium transporter TrkA [Firmicutes bacterium]|nr:Trk system potassium transporter TrkA [Bacillota bacterium]